MIELPLVILSGILGSSHCLGMCGPFALLIGSRSKSRTSAWVRQIAYSAGRISTYAFLGATAGFCGLRIASALPVIVNAAAILCVAAGLVLIYQGALATGWLPNLTHKLRAPCSVALLLKPLLSGSRLRDVFAAGVMTGLLPCGLLYAFVAFAASSRSVLMGALLMTAFGLGTAPLMLATGWSGAVLGGAMRSRLHVIAAYCVILTGAISIARGASFFEWSPSAAHHCPLCAEK